MDTPEQDSAPASEIPDSKTERIAGMRHELAELQRQLLEAQQRIAAELNGRAEDADRYEALEDRLEEEARKAAALIAELTGERDGLRARADNAGKAVEDLRKSVEARDARLEEATRQNRELAEQLSSQTSSLREDLAARDAELAAARAGLADRDAELAARTSERDAFQAARVRLEAELGETRRELEGGRTRAQELAKLIASLGQAMLEAVPTVEPQDARPARSAPPSRPPPPAPAVEQERPAAAAAPPRAPRSSRGLLFLIGGIAVGVISSVAVVQLRDEPATAASKPDEAGGEPAASALPDVPVELAASEPRADADANASANAAGSAAPAAAPTTGIILLPAEADDHRVFVDGRRVDVKDRRVEVRCGQREVQIGSRGEPLVLDVACGGETRFP